MTEYRVRQQEIWDTYTLVEAETPEEAIEKAKDGQGDQVFSDFNRMVDDFAVIEGESHDTA